MAQELSRALSHREHYWLTTGTECKYNEKNLIVEQNRLISNQFSSFLIISNISIR